MAGKGGLLSRITASITKLFTGKELVGFDFNGNRYYRWQDKNSYGEPAEKRMVAFPADVKYDPSLIAPEWHRWLHRTRVDAPTVEELRQGEEQRARLKQRVAALDAAEAARRFQAESLGLQPEQAGPAPDMARFLDQLSGKGYGQGEMAAPEAAAPAGPAAPAEPAAGAADHAPTERRDAGASAGAAGAKFEPETWKPGG